MVFQILAKIGRKIKIGYLAVILKRYNIVKIFLQNCDFLESIHTYIYGANFITKFRWESDFLKGCSMEPPLGTNGSKSNLVT